MARQGLAWLTHCGTLCPQKLVMNQTQNNEPIRLPLWKNALDELRHGGINYGQTIESEWFEEQLRTSRDTMQFGLAVSNIRRELEKDGYYLSGRGQKGDQFVILQPSANAKVMQNYSRAAMDAIKRGVILGTNTRLDTLDQTERDRHERVLEKMATRAALLSRSKQVADLVAQHRPKMLRAV